MLFYIKSFIYAEILGNCHSYIYIYIYTPKTYCNALQHPLSTSEYHVWILGWVFLVLGVWCFWLAFNPVVAFYSKGCRLQA